MHGRSIALRHYGRAGSPLLWPSELAYSQVYARINPDCSCPAGTTWRHQIGLLWERLSQLVDLGLLFSIWGFCFLQLPANDTLVPALIVQCGQSLLHHSICLPLLCCIKGLCIFGPKGTIQIRYYYYYYYVMPWTNQKMADRAFSTDAPVNLLIWWFLTTKINYF